MIKNKKGELSTQQIILLIILIASFAVVLIFLLRLNLGGETKQEICHNSVMMKASTFSSELVPLKCKRNYVCITKDGSCGEMAKPDQKIKVKSLNETYEALANEMANCWWMYGGGKVDYIGKQEIKKNYCSICSQIVFDDSLKEIKQGSSEEISEIQAGNISKDELYNYLAENEYSKDQTYVQYIFNKQNIGDLKTIEVEGKEVQGTFGEIEIKNQYFIIMGITNEINLGWKIVTIATGVAGVASILMGNPAGVALLIFAIGGSSYVVGLIAEGISPEIGAIIVEGEGIENQFMAPTIQKADLDEFKKLHCEDFS